MSDSIRAALVAKLRERVVAEDEEANDRLKWASRYSESSTQLTLLATAIEAGLPFDAAGAVALLERSLPTFMPAEYFGPKLADILKIDAATTATGHRLGDDPGPQRTATEA